MILEETWLFITATLSIFQRKKIPIELNCWRGSSASRHINLRPVRSTQNWDTQISVRDAVNTLPFVTLASFKHLNLPPQNIFQKIKFQKKKNQLVKKEEKSALPEQFSLACRMQIRSPTDYATSPLRPTWFTTSFPVTKVAFHPWNSFTRSADWSDQSHVTPAPPIVGLGLNFRRVESRLVECCPHSRQSASDNAVKVQSKRSTESWKAKRER